MQTTTETNAATGAAGEAPATELSPEVQAARERIRQRLQAEVDAQGALPESRRAAALIGESSIRFTGDGDSDYVIVGPGGQPRHSLEDGSAPFSLRDLAAELRRNYPALFNPDAPPAAAAPSTEPIEAPPQPRDWLMLGPGEASRPGEPAAAAEADNARIETDANAAAPSPPVLAPASRETETADRRDVRTPLAETVPDILPTIGGFRPSYAIYGGVTFVLGVLLALMLWSLWSEPSPDTASGQRASAGATPGPVATPLPRAGTRRNRQVRSRACPRSWIRARCASTAGSCACSASSGSAARRPRISPATSPDARSSARRRSAPTAIAARSRASDLSEVVLYNGGGRATSEATPELKTAEAKARAAGFGIWQKP